MAAGSITFKVNYAVNGGSWVNGAPGSSTATGAPPVKITLLGSGYAIKTISSSTIKRYYKDVYFNANGGSAVTDHLTPWAYYTQYTKCKQTGWERNGSTYGGGNVVSSSVTATWTMNAFYPSWSNYTEWGSYQYGDSITLPSTSRAKYTFTGWYYDGNGSTYSAGASIGYGTLVDYKTFTAQWTAKYASFSTAPTAKTLTYNGAEQNLINAGTASGGTAYYKLGASGTYSTSIPKATNADTYTVYYKVVGDSDHFDLAEQSLNITINKADNPMSITSAQSSSSEFNLNTQTKEFTGANNAQGVVNYIIKSQRLETQDVTNFSINSTTLTAAANTKAGVYTIVITATAAGNDNYKSSSKDITYSWTINPKNISNDITVSGIDANYIYSGIDNKPRPTNVKWGDTSLVENVDYNISYSNNDWVNGAKTSPFTLDCYLNINGIGNYTGIKIVNYTQEREEYTITYDTQSKGVIDNQLFRYGIPQNVASIDNDTLSPLDNSAEGKIFKNWVIDGTSTIINNGALTTFTSNATLTPNWICGNFAYIRIGNEYKKARSYIYHNGNYVYNTNYIYNDGSYKYTCWAPTIVQARSKFRKK